MKTKAEVLAEIKKVLIDEFELDEARLVPDAKLFEDLDLDSIDAVDLVVRLQNITGLKVRPRISSRSVRLVMSPT